MPIDALPIVFLLTISVILGISLVIVIQDLFKLEKQLQKSNEENLAFKQALQKEADILMDEAHTRAMHVVDDANRKAVEIVKSSEAFSNESKTSLKQNLAAVSKAETDYLAHASDELLAEYRRALQEVKTESDTLAKRVTKDIENHAAAEIAAFSTSLKESAIEAQNRIREQTSAGLLEADKAVEAYKQAQLKKAEEHVVQLVRLVTEAALGKGLTLEQHQHLVMEALEEAKSQGVLR